MSTTNNDDLTIVEGSANTAAMLNDLADRFERGEIEGAAVRLYKADGTYTDLVLGATKEVQVAAEEKMERAFKRAH